ncbi:Bax inhibitor-1/YccA family protein [Sphingomonas sp. G-3-2-10]|jgi:FtsH-binding integral membrane protein|uniref:Bax inhibitor-1/YccA family protein n=1 Tax=Sphingomonas sp. G-3-2-10 TaxID=2728838 RepID=UPI00146C0A6E|nr:Bax inhibitor-1/YccA family protein [Sphingomonas sp. G-3-2-10]NML05447.1 Bax inhibitor-1/YccA family protein [Sphingomonas sp. G-3-2-10]
MENFSQFNRTAAAGAQARFDEGLRKHMLGIYRNMGIGLLVTALVSMGVASSPAALALIFGTPLKWVAMFAPLAFIFFFQFRIERMTTAGAQFAFFAFSAVMGVSMAAIFVVYTATSIASAFFAASAMFLGLSLWGYTTNRDISGWGSFLFVGLLALIGVSIVNIFLGSGSLQILISAIGVVIFAGLTAYDTQRIKSEYIAYAGHQGLEKMAVMAALSLYLNLINMFQFLLAFMGQREE